MEDNSNHQENHDVEHQQEQEQHSIEVMEVDEYNKFVQEQQQQEQREQQDEDVQNKPTDEESNGNQQTNQTEETSLVKQPADSGPPRVTPPELPLEWTQLNDNNISRPIRYPSDVMDFPSDETYLEIIGTAGQKITNMGKDLMKQVSPDITHLILRSHLISKVEGIRGMKSLELLELYDNQVEYLDELDGGENQEDEGTGFHLKTLDMSYNVIRDMGPVIYCPNLVELCK